MKIIYSDLKEHDLKRSKHKILFLRILSEAIMVASYLAIVIDVIVWARFPTIRNTCVMSVIAVIFFVCFLFANKALEKYLDDKKKIYDILYIFDTQEKIRSLDVNEQDKIYLTKTVDKYDKWIVLAEIRKQKRGCAVMHQFSLPAEVAVNVEDKVLDFRFLNKKYEKCGKTGVVAIADRAVC